MPFILVDKMPRSRGRGSFCVFKAAVLYMMSSTTGRDPEKDPVYK